MSTSIDPNMPLLVTLPARSWNSLLAATGEGLNAISAIMADVQRQCLIAAQRPPQADDEAEHIPTRVGGAAARPRAARPNGEVTP